MPSVADLIQITQCSNIASQQACNVFYMVVAAWTGNLSITEVLEYWRDTHWLPVAANANVALTGDNITWRNLDNTAEVVTIDNTVDGTNAGEYMGPFVAWSARLYGETAETRSGWKRFAGVSEADQSAGVLGGATLSAYQTDLDVLFGDVAADTGVTGTADAWLINIIVGRDVNGDLDLSRTQPIDSAVVQSRITTQNTRKVGRGS